MHTAGSRTRRGPRGGGGGASVATPSPVHGIY